MPRRLQDKIHSEKRMDLEKYYEIDEESSIAGFEIWSGYGEEIFNSLLSGLSEQDFDNHLIREYNRKMERISATPYFFTPYDAGYRFAGLDPNAKAYIEEVQNAGASTNFIQKNAVNNFCHKTKRDGSWNKISRLFLPIWQNEAANKICLKTLNTGAFLGGTAFHEKGHVRFTGGSSGAYFDAGASLSGTIIDQSGLHSIFYINRQFNSSVFSHLYGASNSTGGELLGYYGRFQARQMSVFNNAVIHGPTSNNLGLITISRTKQGRSFFSIQNEDQLSLTEWIGSPPNKQLPNLNFYFGTLNYNNTAFSKGVSGSFGAFGWGEQMNSGEILQFNSNLIQLWKGCNDQENIAIGSSSPAFLPYERAYIDSQIQSGDYFEMGLQTTSDYAKAIWWDDSSTIDSATDYSNINFSKQKTSEDLISIISIYSSNASGEDVEDSHITHISAGSSVNKILFIDLSKLSQLQLLDLSSNSNLSESVLSTNNFHPSGLNTLTEINLNICDFYSADFSPFINLENIYMESNSNLSNINISGLNNLKELFVQYCNLSEINTNDLTGLQKIFCNSNSGITNLNFENNLELQEIGCADCNLSNLNLDGLINLNYLSVADNINLTGISASGASLDYYYQSNDGSNLSSCSLSSDALNYFFSGLAPTEAGGILVVNNNPGSLTCDTAIATDKGYIVITE